jgi:hypothetical protein
MANLPGDLSLASDFARNRSLLELGHATFKLKSP